MTTPPEQRAPEEPVLWRRSPDLWRLSARLSPERIDRFLRLRSARRLPLPFRARFRAMRIPEETIEETLGEVRGLEDWMTAWNRAAQHFLSEARREETTGRWQEAAVARRDAAMCYHAAHFVTDTDPRTVRALKASGVSAFAQAVAKLMPETQRVGVPWRTSDLPAYLAKPRRFQGPRPLAVIFNGATTTKEECLLWADRFLERGVAVLTVDWPGTGETAPDLPLTVDCDDVTDGLLALAAADPDLAPDMVALIGFSLGGAVAIRAAALDRRIAACVAVTPPYEPRRWIRYVNPIVRHQLAALVPKDDTVERLIEDFSVADMLPRVRCPLLVFGAGRDLVVPPEESLHLTSAAGDLGTLVWYPRGAHGLYAELDDWTAVAAGWIAALLLPDEPLPAPSTRVDAGPPPAAPRDAREVVDGP